MSNTKNNILHFRFFPRPLKLVALMGLMMMMGNLWGQRTDYSGVYYFANSSGYNESSPASNWYLVPADDPQQTDKRDAYYSPNHATQNGDQARPFLTTYKTNKDAATVPSGVLNNLPDNSIWIVRSSGESDYYNIIHASSGKYVVYEVPLPNDPNTNTNPTPGSNGKRKTMHLLETSRPDTLGDIARFKITTQSSGYNIEPKSRSGWYFNPAGGNKNTYYGQSSSLYHGGLVGVYNVATDGGSIWKKEEALCQKPVIDFDELSGSYTISWHDLSVSQLPIDTVIGSTVSRYTIRYTEDGSDPFTNPNGTAQNYDGTTIVVQQDNTTVRAVVVAHSMKISDIADQVVNTAIPDPPTPGVTCDSKLQLSSPITNATIYYTYTTDGSTPDDPNNAGSGTEYTAPVSLPDGAKVKAIAYNGTIASQVLGVYIFHTRTPSPAITLNETEAIVTFESGVTIHYTTSGTHPDTEDAGESTSPFSITGLSYDADVVIHVIGISEGREESCPVTVAKRPKQPTIATESYCSGATRFRTLSFSNTEVGKTYWYTLSNGAGQSAPDPNTSDAYIEYTPGSTVDLTTVPTWNGSDIWVTIHAYAKTADGYVSHIVSEDYMLKYTDAPAISYATVGSVTTVTINRPSTAPAATIYYTLDGGSVQTYSAPFTVTNGYSHTIVATAQFGSEGESCEVTKIVRLPVTILSLSQIVDMNGAYDLDSDVDATGFSTFADVFMGSLNGNYHTISNLSAPLFNVVDGGMVKNVILENLVISSGTNVGAITNEAKGATQIYNCGILSGSVSGSDNVGGLVGLIKENSSVRVVNCYSYANVSGGNYAAGIVGKNEGTVSTDGTVGNVRIALCMMYGNVTGATHISPVYGGSHENNIKNFTEYNYWRYRAELPYTVYNDQMAIEKDDYLTRFPFYRHILNTHRELAAFFLFGGVTCNNVANISDDEIDEIGHWVLKKDVAPYPIIELWEENTKKVLEAPTSSNILTEMGDHGYLNVSVSINGRPYSAQLPITDMDEANYDYTWGKVVLPFANEFEVNADYSKVCTGWKITDVSPSTQVQFEHYNVSDRNCTAKDLFSNTGFVFAQGGNYIVPYGVTAITIEANFATAFYLCDESYEIAYERDSDVVPPQTNAPASGYKTRTTLAGNTSTSYHGQPVYNTLAAALDAMGNSNTTHAQAIVLVGNYHLDDFDLTLSDRTKKGYTFMCIDADNNQEPDYAIYSNNTMNRPAIPPTRYDFVAFIPMGMSSHVTGAKFYPNTPIWKPRGWFEITETGLMWAGQFEIESNNFNENSTNNCRCIINGGYFTQMVRSQASACTRLSYYQIGGNAYVKEFYPGNHSAKSYANKLVPINVTGGEIEQCFMTGYGQGTVYGPDIYFWCAGGKIHKFLGAYMEKPRQTSSSDGNVNMTAEIDHAIIGRFFGGGTSPTAPITGDINVTINNSVVDFYCGGPEFGDMSEGKTVTTQATNTTFGEYYGAGFGGTAITYTNDEDKSELLSDGYTYPSRFFTNHYEASASDAGRLDYKPDYGIGNCYKFEFIMHSRGHQSVARFYTGYAMFSLAKTGNVTNALTNCTVLESFYGGGCQGTVDGTVTSTLTGCTIHHSAFGGGYKAESNEVEVYTTTYPDPLSSFSGPTGIFSDFGAIPTPDTYTWTQGTTDHSNEADETNRKLYTGTDVNMTDLGNVTGAITLTLEGNTLVHESVFGGGNESKSLNNATVTIKGNTEVQQNVFGGGNKAKVGQNTTVILSGSAHVRGNVYGGGNNGAVGGNSKVEIRE